MKLCGKELIKLNLEILGDIGHAIQEFSESNGYTVVRDFCGYGIGEVFHCAPNVLHYGNKGEGITIQEGMIFTIEPMINLGKKDKILQDGWTAVTKDKKLSAQFEHTIGVTKMDLRFSQYLKRKKYHKAVVLNYVFCII